MRVQLEVLCGDFARSLLSAKSVRTLFGIYLSVVLSGALLASPVNVVESHVDRDLWQPKAPRLSRGERAWLAAHPEIRIGYDSHYAPIEMMTNGKHDGMTSDYLEFFRRQLRAAGVTTKLSVSSKEHWEDTYKQGLNGELDMFTCLFKTEQRLENFRFSKPYLSLKTAIITAKGRVMGGLSINGLNGRKVAVVAGYYWEDILSKEHPKINILKVKTMAEGLERVAFGSADAFLGTLAPVTHYLSEKSISNLEVSGLTPYSLDYRVGVRKDWPEFVGIINKLIDAMPTVDREKIEKHWINLEGLQNSYYLALARFFGLMVAVVVGLALVLSVWNLSLRQKVARRTEDLRQLNLSLEDQVKTRTHDLKQANEQLRFSQRELKKAVRQLEEIAHQDGLTQVANRRKLDDSLLSFFQNRQQCFPSSILMVDVDWFKGYNDEYGHQEGDECLKKVATILAANVRREFELVARYGGEEFAIFLPHFDEKKALKLAEVKRHAVQKMAIPHRRSKLQKRVTVSIGVATITQDLVRPEDNIQWLISRADAALYEAKRKGRNCCVHASQIGSNEPGSDVVASLEAHRKALKSISSDVK